MSSKTNFPGVRKRGDSIQIDFRYKGVRCRETLPIKPTATNLETAANLRGKIRLDITLDKLVYSDYFPKSDKVQVFGHKKISNMTVAQGFEWWLEDFKSKSDKTKKIYVQHINKHIIPGLGNIILRDLKASQVKKWISTIDLSISSKNGILTPLRFLLAEAYSEELVDDDIMQRISNETRPKKDKKPLTIGEIDTLSIYFKNHCHDAMYYYQFAIWSGLSSGEHLGLQWGDINFDKYQISIKRMLVENKEESTKNSYRNRTIELLHPALLALEALKPHDYDQNSKKYNTKFIFINPKTDLVWRNEAISQSWNQALKVLKIEHRRAYETRHTYASLMISACLPDGWVRHQMGHATMKMLEEVYGKWHGDTSIIIDWILKHTKDGKNGADFTRLFLDLHKK